MKYAKLFSPVKVGSCVFPNRIMSTAAVTRLATEDGHVTQNIMDRYRRLAAGGVGSIVVEAAVVLPSRSSFNLRISDDQFIEEIGAFVREIKKVNGDTKIGLQLIHFLKVARSGWRQKVEDLKPEEIGIIPAQFAEAAVRARSAGFDFVELHMAHFTTLASFLSLVNKRQDEYGGDFEGRVKAAHRSRDGNEKSRRTGLYGRHEDARRRVYQGGQYLAAECAHRQTHGRARHRLYEHFGG